jgi:hypothetical protein
LCWTEAAFRYLSRCLAGNGETGTDNAKPLKSLDDVPVTARKSGLNAKKWGRFLDLKLVGSKPILQRTFVQTMKWIQKGEPVVEIISS